MARSLIGARTISAYATKNFKMAEASKSCRTTLSVAVLYARDGVSLTTRSAQLFCCAIHV